jgi:hypothetical protein
MPAVVACERQGQHVRNLRMLTSLEAVRCSAGFGPVRFGLNGRGHRASRHGRQRARGHADWAVEWRLSLRDGSWTRSQHAQVDGTVARDEKQSVMPTRKVVTRLEWPM